MSNPDKPSSLYQTFKKPSAAEHIPPETEQEPSTTEPFSTAGALNFPDHDELESRLNAVENQLNETVCALDDTKRQLLQAHADMANIRRRAEEDIKKAKKYGEERLVRDLLAVLDSLESGLNIDIGDNPFAQQVYQGLEMTYKLFIDTLGKFSVKPINPLGERFNPEQHQAISTQAQVGVPSGQVIQVLQKGYLLHDRLLRPALVVVAQ